MVRPVVKEHFLKAARTYCMIARAMQYSNPDAMGEYLRLAREQMEMYKQYEDVDQTDIIDNGIFI